MMAMTANKDLPVEILRSTAYKTYLKVLAQVQDFDANKVLAEASALHRNRYVGKLNVSTSIDRLREANQMDLAARHRLVELRLSTSERQRLLAATIDTGRKALMLEVTLEFSHHTKLLYVRQVFQAGRELLAKFLQVDSVLTSYIADVDASTQRTRVIASLMELGGANLEADSDNKEESCAA